MTESSVNETVPTTNLLSRDSLLKKNKRKTQVVYLPELGGNVFVQQMTARERGEFEAYFTAGSEKSKARRMAQARERLVVATVVDESGNRLFTPADLDALSEQPAIILERICVAAQELNAITEDDLEEIAGN